MRQKDVDAALENGADAVGFVVGSPKSPRNLSLGAAGRLMKSVPVFASKVAVTSSDDLKSIWKICSALGPDALQLHRHNHKLIGIVRKTYPEIGLILTANLRDGESLSNAASIAVCSDAVLADTPSSTGMGGTGQTHDWNLTARLRERIHPHPLILAGGLTPHNVIAAIRRVKPYAVDVSSGVEKSPGIKDHQKVREFILCAKENLS
jgi:phosphoribosylanthranilate isomerase